MELQATGEYIYLKYTQPITGKVFTMNVTDLPPEAIPQARERLLMDVLADNS